MLDKIQSLPIGFSKVSYNGETYGVTRKDFNNGQSIKVYAEELGGEDFISFNFYITHKSKSLKPCEMPREKVIDFLNKYFVIRN